MDENLQTELDFSLAHVGINCEDETGAQQTAQTLWTLFGMGV